MSSSSESESSPVDAAALKLGLPIRVQVTLDETSDLQHWRLVRGPAKESQVSADFWLQMSPWYAGFAMGIYAALSAGLVFIACMIAVQSVYLIRHHWAQHRTQLFPSALGIAPQTNIVEVTQDGIAEIDREVTSVMPWTSMKRWLLKQNILFVELTNARWLVIPAAGMEPNALDLQKLSSFLKTKGIPGRLVEN